MNGRTSSVGGDRDSYFNDSVNATGLSQIQYKNPVGNNYGSNQVSPNVLQKKFERDQEDFARLPLEDINRELDINSKNNRGGCYLNRLTKHVAVSERNHCDAKQEKALDYR